MIQKYIPLPRMLKRIYLHIASLLLILLTLQNAVGELYYHDIEHETSNLGASIYHHYDGDGHAHLSIHCTCIHDFTIPGNTPSISSVPVPEFCYLNGTHMTLYFFLLQDKVIDAAFRGPPVC